MAQEPMHIGNDEIEIAEGSLAEQLVSEKFDFNQWLQHVVTHMGPWLVISAAFHVVLLIVMASIVMSEPLKVMDDIKTIKLPPPEEDTELDMELPRDVIENDKPCCRRVTGR